MFSDPPASCLCIIFSFSFSSSSLFLFQVVTLFPYPVYSEFTSLLSHVVPFSITYSLVIFHFLALSHPCGDSIKSPHFCPFIRTNYIVTSVFVNIKTDHVTRMPFWMSRRMCVATLCACALPITLWTQAQIRVMKLSFVRFKFSGPEMEIACST
jgi:hypothetical protein